MTTKTYNRISTVTTVSLWVAMILVLIIVPVTIIKPSLIINHYVSVVLPVMILMTVIVGVAFYAADQERQGKVRGK